MRRGWSWVLRTWAKLTGDAGRTFRLIWPERAQAPAVTTVVCTAKQPIEIPDSLPETARGEAMRIREQFEGGAWFSALSRTLPPGAECRLEIREEFAGKTATHLVVMSTCRKSQLWWPDHSPLRSRHFWMDWQPPSKRPPAVR